MRRLTAPRSPTPRRVGPPSCQLLRERYLPASAGPSRPRAARPVIRITDRRAARVDAEFVGRLRAAAIALALLPLCAAPALGAPRAEGAFDEDEPRLAATLLVHPDDDPAGQRVRVGVWFEPDPGWHLYWRNPGETGLPTRIEFQVEGGRAGPLAWPAPRAYR